jgi:hypothetical protein
MSVTSHIWRARLNGSPQAKDALGKMHLPTGTRRFRPTVEDVVEFLVVEGIVEARDGWERVLNASRDRFHRRQLHAVIRRHPDLAAEQLRIQGYRIDDPAA